MHGLRWRYVWRDLLAHKMRTLLVILSIAIGIFAFAIIAGTATTLNTTLPETYQGVRPASATIHTSHFDDEQVAVVRHMPEVALAEGRSHVLAQYRNASGEWHDIELFAREEYERDPAAGEQGNQINIVYPSQGDWPPNEREMLIERNSLRLTDTRLGESLLIETNQGDQRLVPITGLAHDMNQPPAQITGVPYGYVTRDTMEWLGLNPDFNQLQLVVAKNRYDKAHITEVAQEIADKLERSGVTVLWVEVPNPGEHFVMDFLPTIVLILSFLGILALVLSGFLVINVITAILTQQTRQIGVMKSIGGQPMQIAGIYLRLVIALGVLALVMAVPLGALGAYAFSRFIAGQLNFDLTQWTLSAPVLAVEIVVGLLVPIVAGIFPISRSARMTVREALQDQGLGTENAAEGRVDRGLRSLQQRLPISRPMRLSLRNTFRRKGRLIRTLIPLMLGGAIFMTVLTVRVSLFQTLEETLAAQGFDVQILLSEPYRIDRVAEEAMLAEGVTAVEVWTSREGAPVHADGSQGDSVRVYALPAETQLFETEIIAGRWLLPEDTNAIVVPKTLLQDEPDVELGGEITLTIDDVETTWRVVGVNQVFTPPIAPGMVYVNQPHFWHEMGNHNRGDTLRALTADHDLDAHIAASSALEQRFDVAGFDIRSIRNATEDRDIFTERFNLITVILMFMATLLATVGSLGLMGTMSINVLERTREIGVMRAIGASSKTVLQIFVSEGVVIGALSWVGAVLLSLPLSRLLSDKVGMTFAQLPLSYVYDLRSPIFWLLIVLIVSSLASLIPSAQRRRTECPRDAVV